MQYIQQLNEVQKKAVTHGEGPMLVIAGPGSGKTRVLTYRIAYLIDSGVPPHQILALTFTNKAAREMKDRIEKVVGPRVKSVWAGTFHAVFARILRIESEKIGYPSSFTIYDTDDSKNLINAIIKESGLDTKSYNANAIRNRISSAKSNLITHKEYADNPELLGADRSAGMPQLHMIYAKYVLRCQRSGAMDFDDLLYQTYRLFAQNPDNIVEKYRTKFCHLLVDEFQDTNFLQYAIIKKLSLYPGSPRNICVVGDDAQSIYAFRGATIDNILNFEKDFSGLKVFKLEQNYRSTPFIVKAANDVITYNEKQIKKEIWTEHEEGEKIKLVKALSDAEEAKRIVDIILEQKNRNHLRNTDIAILYRTNAQSRLFEEYLRRYNISYRIYGGLSFYQRKEIKDFLAYLRLTNNKSDDEALRRIINYPKRGIGNTTLEKIIVYANAKGISFWEALKEAAKIQKAKSSLTDFVRLIEDFSDKATTIPIFDLATYIVNRSGIASDLKSDNTIEGQGRLENIQAILDAIKEFQENDELLDEATLPDKSLSSYLQSIALITDLDESTEQQETVTLMSVHAAKGLEFKSVFVVGLEENLFPSAQSIRTREGIDEERRLFYVAITRAEQYLTLSYAKSRYKFGKISYDEPSRFIQEISDELFENKISRVESSNAPRSGISNYVRPPVRKLYNPSAQQVAGFEASPISAIQPGVEVMHQRFGRGKVLKVDGANDGKVATIKFDNTFDEEKRIVLRFAKLQVL
jgi:DNA helicase II / ATP-dependent DNA helicase PcrA